MIKVGDRYTNGCEIRTISLSGAGNWVAVDANNFSVAHIGHWSKPIDLEESLKRNGYYKLDMITDLKEGDKFTNGKKVLEIKKGRFWRFILDNNGMASDDPQELYRRIIANGWQPYVEAKVGDVWKWSYRRGYIAQSAAGYSLINDEGQQVFQGYYNTIEMLVNDLLKAGCTKEEENQPQTKLAEGERFRNAFITGIIKQGRHGWYLINVIMDSHVLARGSSLEDLACVMLRQGDWVHVSFPKEIKTNCMETKIEIKRKNQEVTKLVPKVSRYYIYGGAIFQYTTQGMINIHTGCVGWTDTGLYKAISERLIQEFEGEIKITQ